MGCSNSSNIPIPTQSALQNKRGESSSGKSKDETEDMLTVPKIVKKDDKLQLPTNRPIGSSTGNPRNKVALMPGRSMIDWMKYHKNAPDPSGTGGKMSKVTKKELAKHNKEDDAWIAINGMVYNITPYMEYHPGGIPELMRGAGIDGTQLFNEVHRWVNYESMLKRCCVGTLDTSFSFLENIQLTFSNSKPLISTQGEMKKPRYSWSQKEDIVTITITTYYDNIQRHHVTVDFNDLNVIIHVIVKDHVFTVDINLEASVENKFTIIKSSSEKSEIDIIFTKIQLGTFWSVIGSSNPDDSSWKVFSVADLTYRDCRLLRKYNVTQDTYFFEFKLPLRSFCVVPVGCHVFLRASVDGFQINKPYTVVPPALTGINSTSTTISTTSDGDDDDVCAGSLISFIIKVYPDGLLTPTLDRLKEGDQLDMSTTYTGNSFEEKLRTMESVKRVVLIVAGTGITPMISIINHLHSVVNHLHSDRDCNDVVDGAKIRSVDLLFFNKSEEDIIWRKDFETFAEKNKWFTITSILSSPSSSWKGSTGRINKELLLSLKVVGGGDDDDKDNTNNYFYCVCGPQPFTSCTIDILHCFSVHESHIHAFTE